MRKILSLLLVAVMGLMVTGCQKNNETSIVGSWRLAKVGPTMDQLVDASSIGTSMSINIQADGTWSGTGFAPQTAPMELPALKSASPDNAAAQGSGTWEYSASTKTLHLVETGYGAYDINVTKLTSSEMIWNWQSGYFVFRK